MEELSLIDVSAAEDDFLFDLASPPPHPDPPFAAASSSAVGAGASDLVPARGYPAAVVGNVMDPSGPSEHVPERTESPKKMKAKSGINLRKSLAWDSAFFTSEGVLDTEELGLVNSTLRKARGSRLLPGIAEEMRKSGESTTSTLGSESFMLESLETELFDNVRASIQRTLGKPDKAPGMHAASSKTARATTKAPSVAAGKGADRIPQSKIRPRVSASNCSISSKQRPQVTSKMPTAAGVKDPPPAAEAKPSLKPPRALPRVATMRASTNTTDISKISDKRSSTGTVVNRQAAGKSANTSTNLQHRPGGVTKSSSTLKSGALSSAANSPLSNVSMGSTPAAKTKSPTLINKNRTAQRVQIRSSSKSHISKDISARTSRNKVLTKSHGGRASPIISPSSSLESLSSMVSGASTASTAGKMSHTSESFSTISSPLSPSLRKSNDQLPTTKSRPPTVTEGQSFGTPSADTLKASKDTTTHGKGVRPSGLRRPTPKIGYFDQQESKTMVGAPHEESSPPRTKVSTSLFRTVEQMEVKPSSVTENQVSMHETSTVVNADVAKEIAPVLQHNIQAPPALLLRAAQIQVKPPTVTEQEASMCKTGTVINVDVGKETVPALHQNMKANGSVSPSIVEVLSPKMLSASFTFGEQESKHVTAAREESNHCHSQTKVSPSLPLGVAAMEVEPSKVTEHDEASTHRANPEVTAAAEIAEENIQPVGVMSPLKENIYSKTLSASSTFGEQESKHVAAAREESSPSQTKVSPSLPLGVAPMEVEPSKVTEHDEASTHRANPEVTAAAAIAEENIQPVGVMSPLKENIYSKTLSASTFGEQESKHVAAAREESSPSQTKVSPSLPLGVAPMEVEPSKVTVHEASTCQANPQVNAAAETAKENIQPVGVMSPLKENIPAAHQNTQGTVDASPLTLLAKKLSSISIAEASPMTQLSRKLSSISLGETTDHVS